MLRPMYLALAAVLSLAAIDSASASATADLDAFAVPAFDFSSLGSSSQQILQALQSDGIISLKNIPLYTELRAAYLQEATQCALAASQQGDAFLQYKTLQDGTQRFTISTTSGKRLATAAEDTRARCPEYVAKYRELSELVEITVASLGKSLDATGFQVTSHDKLTGSQLMSESVHLDHFHAYEASASSRAGSPVAQNTDDLLSLELHTDNGMLIAMTAPKYFDVATATNQAQPKTLATYESGLLIENRAGKLVRPVIKEDELVLMVGSGFQEWIRSSPALRPVPHAMKYPTLAQSDASRLIRAWFGKMVLLSAEERMLNVDMTFGDFAKRTSRYLMDHNAVDESPSGFATLACPRGRRLHDSDGACVVKQCFPKAGKDPETPCSIQCNLSPKSRPGADRLCEENCECTTKPSNTTATYCWMLCVSQLPEDSCGTGVTQRCKTGKEAPYIVDQAFVCNVTSNSTTTAESVTAPASAVPSTSSSAGDFVKISVAVVATVATLLTAVM